MNHISYFILDVYDSWEKLGTMGASFRTGNIYKKVDQKNIANQRLLNLDNKIYTTIFKSRMQKALDAIIDEN